MRRALSSLTFLGVVFGALAQDGGRLLSVRAGGDEVSSSVELVGNQPLSFTTLQLQSPPRVVVDFADTDVAGAPAELSVEDGTIRRVATAAAGARTARVVIELAADAEFDVRAKGNRVEIRVPRIAPLLARNTAPPAPPQPTPTPPVAEAQPTPPAPEAQPTPPAPEAQAAPPAAEPRAAPPSEAEKRASLPTVSLVGAGPAAPEAPEPKPPTAAQLRRIAREKLADEKRAAAAAAAAEQKRAAAEAVEARRRARATRLAAAAAERRSAAERAAESRRLVAERAAEAKRVAAERRAAAKAKAASEKKLAAAERAAQVRAPVRPPSRERPPAREPSAERRAAGEPPLLTVEEAKALRAAAEQGLPTGLGAKETTPPAAPPRRTARAEPARAGPPRIAINSIGFRPVGNGELIIRSDRPLRYGVGGDERSVLLHLPGSSIPRPNDRRPLDTHFFDGPVLRVVPVEVPGGIDLRIELRSRAEYQLSQAGPVLTVVFSAAR